MKTTRFLLAASIIMLALTLTLSCSPIEEAAEDITKASEGEQPSPSSAIVEEGEKEPIPSSSSIAIAEEDPLPPSSSSITYPKIMEIYLGCGYDVINSSYVNRNDVKVSFPVLDIDKMHYDNMIQTDTSTAEQKFDTFIGSSLQEFYKSRNASITLSYGAALFSGKASTEFKTSTSGSTSVSYVRGRSYRYTRDDYIRGASPTKLANYFTKEFINDLEIETAAQILDRYGTHVLIRYYKGGSLEFNYTYKGSELNSSSKLTAAINASYGFFNGSASYQDSTSRKELESNSEFFYYTHGGKGFSSTEMSGLMAEYGAWITSINDYADITGIGDFSNSFLPLWDLVKAGGYPDKASELESEFDKRVKAQEWELGKEERERIVEEKKKAALEKAAAAKSKINAAKAVRDAEEAEKNK